MNETYGNAGVARTWLRAALAVDGFMLCLALCAVTNSDGGLAWLLLLALAGITGLALRNATKQGYWFVRRIERTWKHTCAGLNFVGEGNDYLASVRAGVRSGGKYYVPAQTKVIYPQLKNVRGNDQAWSAEVRFFDGQTIEQYNAHADAYALAYSVPFCSFDLAESGLIRIRAGNVPVPDAYEHPGHVQATQAAYNRALPQPSLSVDEVPPGVLRAAQQMIGARAASSGYEQEEQGNEWAYELELLKAVPMARDLNGRVCKIPIEGQHWFIAARTGGGKSSWIWSLVLGLEPAWRLGLVKLWGIDSKMIELSIARGWFEHYADDDESSVELLERCVRDMHERSRQMQGVRRKFTPSVETPLNVVVIDEMGYLSAFLSDKKMQARANTAIAALLAKGRAPGYAVLGATTDPRKEVCGFRDGFSIRIAGSLPAPMVDLVLGEGMYAAGAYCNRIPLTEPGVAYVISETTLKPVLVRAAWCDDTVIQ